MVFLDRTLHDFFLQSVYSNRAYNSKRRFSVVRTKRIPAKPGLEQSFLFTIDLAEFLGLE